MRPHLASLVDDWRRSRRDRAVVLHRGNRSLPTRYQELAQLAGRFAAELADRGIAAGDRVLLWGENSAEWIAAFFGCVLRGVLVVPLDATGSAAFAERVLGEVSPKLVVGDAGLLAGLTLSVPSLILKDLQHVVPVEPQFAVAPEVTLDAPLQIVFTSGTTSEPKGVVHTHRNVLASVAPIEKEIGRYRLYERPFHPLRFLHTLPLSHVFGQFMGMWLPPLLGAEVHFLDGLEPSRLLATIKRERVSVLVAVPRILELLRGHLVQRAPALLARLEASHGLPAWKRWWCFRDVHRLLGLKFWALICGGATLPAELEGFWNGLGLALVQGYGMTETAALVTLNHPFHVGKGTLGKTLPGREVRLNAEGEIEVRGDVLAAGTWRGGRFEPRADEWLATGDLGVQEGSGELRFAGRRGDVIVTAAGLNVHPQDVEAALLAQGGVRACAVVGCETARGPEPVGVVLFEGDEGALGAAVAAANARLAAFQQLRYVLRWPGAAFPYTATGKLLRRRIAAWACAEIGTVHRKSAGSTEGADPLLALIAQVTHEAVRDGDDEQRLTEELHLDSLGRVQLQSALETQLGAEIRDEAIAGARTLGELRGLVGEALGRYGDAVARLATKGERPAARLSEVVAGPEPLRYPRWPWSRPVQWLRVAFVELVVRPLVGFLAAPWVVAPGAATLRGPMLLVANHVNVYDLPLILYALPGPLRRRVAAAMSAEVLEDLRHGRGQRHPLLNLLARPAAWLLVALFNVFPLPRLRGFRQSFQHAGEALDLGYSVLIFPEGRRSFTGELQPFRPGIGLLVGASGVPVLPILLQGTGSKPRAGRGWFRTGEVVVRIGEPIWVAEGGSAEEITGRLEVVMRGLETAGGEARARFER